MEDFFIASEPLVCNKPEDLDDVDLVYIYHYPTYDNSILVFVSCESDFFARSSA